MDAKGDVAPPSRFELELIERVGARVRTERLQRRLTLQDVANRCGLSVGMLSKVENGQISPSLRTLGQLSRALETPVTVFFRDLDEEHDASFVKAGQGISVSGPEEVGHRYELLTAPFQQRRGIEAWLVELPEGAVSPLFQGGGSELMYMLTGRVEWRYGRKKFCLEPGDALLLDGLVPHGPECVLEGPARYLAVIIADCPRARSDNGG
jgi:transcriptional regulator with XRE-family HTH domain